MAGMLFNFFTVHLQLLDSKVLHHFVDPKTKQIALITENFLQFLYFVLLHKQLLNLRQNIHMNKICFSVDVLNWKNYIIFVTSHTCYYCFLVCEDFQA